MAFEAITPLRRGQRFILALVRAIDFVISETVGFNALAGDTSFEEKLALRYAKRISNYQGDLNPHFSKNVYGKAILLYKNSF
ncbi:hypothetical protein N4Q63_08290 [Leclercia adecarboxylata]|uniref:Uncharacterized protein n=1 Tax=Leclercia adecarboxylata TaxID=83655 RepID=A0A9X3Y975_9ENTR|nr:hypothetical protein [Leclercia adecarboxylata]MBD1404266.1 hypothetical protein [Leclercia adecarboxylata]MDC6621895.1 hypothetical protein [Leclercia adecarboxylata]MDC6632967.1 hypothetical protein [Leclercia adecarboxylata]MDC6638263.1 hypothetical protein [Leclercia adecarboxylata]MDC6649006.1 hypothetical protein [Leclercia adecarboxylata]